MNITHEKTGVAAQESEHESEIIHDVNATNNRQAFTVSKNKNISKQLFKLVDTVTPNYVLGYN
ncbi:hypothetical protein [Thalassotalea atypica]|uniref:hypothetical protein n=1 Tax=Thalassotalea atypica TaxID=2054316 RepID=UPI00257331CF|nr:hypothetical protein [Thalassotalea atypica]